MSTTTPGSTGFVALDVALLFASGAIASGINAVAGGGSLVSYPVLTLGLHIPDRIANATNSVGLFPGSLAGGVGFLNQLEKTKKFLKPLLVPTILGSMAGAVLLLNTSDKAFKAVVPFLILLASVLLFLQPRVKKWMNSVTGKHTLPLQAGMVIQFLVAVYGGFFGAGMGIMMLAAFALFMDGDTHELNAVKNWLGTIINISCSGIFLARGLVLFPHALYFMAGSVVGGLASAKVSQKIDSDKLRRAIAVYGFVMTAFYIWRIGFGQ